MIRFIFFSIFILFVSKLFSQGFLPVGARSNSIANASIALSDCWSYYHNPGALGVINKSEIGVSYSNRFLLKELQNQGLVYVQPIKKGVLSFGVQFFGLDVYRGSRIGGGYSLKLSDKLFSGVQLNYQRLQLSSNYGVKNSVTAEAGIYYMLNDQWRIGVSIFNLGRAKLSSFENERVSTIMRLGTVYQISKKVLFALEIDKNVNYLPRLKGGIEYIPVKNVYLRGGIATQPIEFTFGLGSIFKSFQLDIGSSYQQVLGWSPHFSLCYKLK